MKPTPLTVTCLPAAPLAGVNVLIESVAVNLPLLVTVPAGVLTQSLPLISPSGTVAAISVAERIWKLAESVPKCTGRGAGARGRRP